MTTNTATATPRHLLPESCYVCGGAPHGATFTETGQGHNYWSNADAAAEFRGPSVSDGPTWADGVFSEDKPWPEIG